MGQFQFDSLLTTCQQSASLLVIADGFLTVYTHVAAKWRDDILVFGLLLACAKAHACCHN